MLIENDTINSEKIKIVKICRSYFTFRSYIVLQRVIGQNAARFPKNNTMT